MRDHVKLAMDYKSAETEALEAGEDEHGARALGLIAVAREASVQVLREFEALIDASPAVTWTGPGGVKDRLNEMIATVEDWS